MNKMAAMPTYGKNPLKIFSGTCRPISTKLGMQHRGLKPIIVCSNDDPQVTLTCFMARSNLVTLAFLWKKVKKVDFSETIAACDLKVGRCRQLIDNIGQGHFFTIYFAAVLYVLWLFTGPLVLWFLIITQWKLVNRIYQEPLVLES